jgi:protein phosphatase
VVSSDACRALVSDDERDQSASEDAFELMHVIVEKRLRHNRLSVVDATNVRLEQRAPLLTVARRHRRPAVAVVFDLPEDVCVERNRGRSGRSIPERVLQQQLRDLRDSLATLHAEGFSKLYVLGSPEEAAQTRVVRD